MWEHEASKREVLASSCQTWPLFAHLRPICANFGMLLAEVIRPKFVQFRPNLAQLQTLPDLGLGFGQTSNFVPSCR